MKKITTLFLSLLLIISMTACGDDPESSKDVHRPQKPSAHQENKEEDEEEDEEYDDDVEEEDEETTDPDIEDEPEEDEEEKDEEVPSADPVTGSSFDFSNGIPEGGFLLADNNEFSILLTSVEEDNYMGYTLNTTITNKSDTLSYYFTVDHVSINGVSCNAIMFDEAAPGESIDSTISFSDFFVSDGTIGDISQIDLVLSAQDGEYENDPIITDDIFLYPAGEANATVYEYEPADEDIPVFENDAFKVILTHTEYDDVWGYTAAFYLENKTDSIVLVDFDDAVVNGSPIDVLSTNIIHPNLKTFSLVSFYSDDLDEAGITSVSDIQMKLSVNDFTNYGQLFVDETVSIQPEPISW